MKKILFVLMVVILSSCNPCKYVAKHPECFPADTIKITEQVIHIEKEYMIKDSIHFDTVKDRIKETIYQTKVKYIVDTIKIVEKVSKINPINAVMKEQIVQLNKSIDSLIAKNKVKNKVKSGFFLSGIIIGLVLFIVVRILFKKFLLF